MLEGDFRPDRTPLVAPDQIDWHIADLTATIGADVRWSDLGSQPNLWLPIDCDGDPDATIGRLVEHNSTGPLRIGFGGWRDLLLGCQFRDGRGELITAGGRTVKNVAGYDLTKFLIGQAGVFGRIVTITTRLHRKPHDACRAQFPPELEFLSRLLASPCRPQWTMLTPEALYCGYLGDQRTIDFYMQQLPARNPTQIERTGFAADQHWRSQTWRAPLSSSSPSPGTPGEGWGGGLKKITPKTMRAQIPSTKIQDFASSADLTTWVADPTFGVVLATVSDPAAAQSAALAAGGRAWFFDESSQLTFSPSPQEKVILDRLKKTLDPQNALAPLPW
jgi:hypothetical protein